MEEKLLDLKNIILFLPVITATNQCPGPQSSIKFQKIPLEQQIICRQPWPSAGGVPWRWTWTISLAGGWSPLLVKWQDRRVTAVPIKGRRDSDICFSRRLHFSWLHVSKWKTLQQKSTVASPFLCRGRDIFDWLCSGATLGEVAEQGGSDLYGSSFMSGSSWPKKGDRHSSHLGQAISPFREAWSPAWDWMIGHI